MLPRRRGRAPSRAGRNGRSGCSGRNGRAEESDADVELSHHGDEEVTQSGNRDGHRAPNMTLDKWLDMKMDKFDGSGTPMDAASWLHTMQKYMDATVMTPEDRVVYVAFQLKGLADACWEGVRSAWTQAHGPLTWDVFVQRFTAKYYPTSFKEKMDVALRNIKQGSKTVDEYETEFSKIVHFVDHVNHNEGEKTRRFFEGLNSEYRHAMAVNRPNDYFTVVEQARALELQFQLTKAEADRTLTKAEADRTGGSNSSGSGHKRSYHDGRESSQQPYLKKLKPVQQFQQSFKPRQSGSQSSSAPRFLGTSSIRPVPGQGLICFKCGDNHRASECEFKGSCHHCGRDGNKSKVCKTNPNSIIKWQSTTPSVGHSPAAGPSRGASLAAKTSHGCVHMMTSPQQYYPQYQPHYQPFPPQHFQSQQFPHVPPGYFLHSAPLPASYVPLQLPAPPTTPAPPHQTSGVSSSALVHGIYTMPAVSSLGRPDVVAGTQPSRMHGRE